MNPLLKRKFKLLLLFCFFSIPAGMLYQRLNNGYIDHNAFIVGFVMGLTFGVLELFMLTKLNRRIKTLPIPIIILTKTIVYTVIIFWVSNLLGLIAGYFEGKTWNTFFDSLHSIKQLYFIIYSLIVFGIMLFFLQISRLLGEGVLFKILHGKYNRPVEEDRIFMFLDIRSSTSIAEKIGHEKFYSLLNSFFHEITDPVLITKSEIYQYVGDEVVFTWKTNDGLRDANCVQLFFLIKNKIKDNQEYYLNRYGIVPKFKAGIHFGKVIVGQIGDIKREIVYNGDVLNTTSRLQDLCNKYNNDLIISRTLLSKLHLPEDIDQEYLGKVKLRGKEKDINIYGLSQKS
jgi:adenylate cyclase